MSNELGSIRTYFFNFQNKSAAGNPIQLMKKENPYSSILCSSFDEIISLIDLKNQLENEVK